MQSVEHFDIVNVTIINYTHQVQLGITVQDITIKDDNTTMPLTLWRQLTQQNVQVGNIQQDYVNNKKQYISSVMESVSTI